jgi:adenylate kinase family enzyme
LRAIHGAQSNKPENVIKKVGWMNTIKNNPIINIGKDSRILIIGTSGSGKSELARRISKKTGLKDIELDALFWKENWKQTEKEEFREKVRKEIDGARGYVIHGNYSGVRDITWNNVDTIIWLNYSIFIVMWRVIARTIYRIITRQKLWSGNTENIKDSFLSKESIILWSWNTYDKRKMEYRKLIDEKTYGEKSYIEIAKPKEAHLLLEKI